VEAPLANGLPDVTEEPPSLETAETEETEKAKDAEASSAEKQGPDEPEERQQGEDLQDTTTENEPTPDTEEAGTLTSLDVQEKKGDA
jgi:hypothetical protein